MIPSESKWQLRQDIQGAQRGPGIVGSNRSKGRNKEYEKWS